MTGMDADAALRAARRAEWKHRLVWFGAACAALTVAVLCATANAQMGPNPYRNVDGLQAGQGPGRIGEPWAKLPGGREIGSPGGLEIDRDGEHLWAILRCGNDGTPRGSHSLRAHPSLTIQTFLRSFLGLLGFTPGHEARGLPTIVRVSGAPGAEL